MVLAAVAGVLSPHAPYACCNNACDDKCDGNACGGKGLRYEYEEAVALAAAVAAEPFLK
jgi:hypothetical protein